MSRTGLTLTGGGAHAAYQVGVLRAIAELTRTTRIPFQVVTGVSAGAINAMGVASRADDFQFATRRLWDLWQNLKSGDVFRTDAVSLLGIGTRWIRDLSLGGFLGSSRSVNLLDTAPMEKFLSTHLDMDRIRDHLRNELLHGIAVTATNYVSGEAVTFFDGDPSIEPWFRSARSSMRDELTLRHVMASAAIPIFFPPVKLDGSFYGDGCIRLTAPLSASVHLGSDQVLAIGIRHPGNEEFLVEMHTTTYSEPISLVDIAGILLNAVFLDSLSTDLDRMQRINRTLSLLTPEQQAAHPDRLRPIPVLAITPSRDLGALASEQFQHFPIALRHLLRGVGASERKGWDLLSYLAFDGAYTTRLLELGFQDGMRRRDEIVDLLRSA